MCTFQEREAGEALPELSYKTTTVGLAAYLTSTNDSLLRLVQQQESRKMLNSM